MKHTFILFGLLILFFGCNTDCENEKVGDVSYAPETQAFLNFQAGESISYMDEDGNIMEFDVTLEPNTTSQLCTKVICRPSDPFDSNGCEYVEGPSHYYVLRSDELFLHFKTGISMYQFESMLFYDWIEVGLTSEVANLFGGKVTAQNFPIDDLVFENTFLENELIFFTESAQGSHSNVWVVEDLENEVFIYLNETTGIVAFKIGSNIWTLY